MNRINQVNASLQKLNQALEKNEATQKTKWTVLKNIKNFFRSCLPTTTKKPRNTPIANRQARLASPTQYTASTRVEAKTNKSRVPPHGSPINNATLFKKYENASQNLPDLKSIIYFKKDLYSARSSHKIDDAQFTKLSGKVATALFKLARNPGTGLMPRQTIITLVGSNKASEILATNQKTNQNHTSKLKATQTDKKEDISLTDNQAQQLLEGLDEIKQAASTVKTSDISPRETQTKQQLRGLDDQALSTLPLSNLSNIKTFKQKLQASYRTGSINERQYNIHNFQMSIKLKDLIRRGETKGLSAMVLKNLVPPDQARILQKMLALSLHRRRF
ncbi:MAG: hypothetical protein QS721_04490 [Candidatus Endonucleobacter sp. (ex Gigantidas childressi)]|nr:hypothetical protein [Candidatus Endonucleobacter sp. (ex Gigantidas childressi)]